MTMPYLIKAPLKLFFSEVNNNNRQSFEKEFNLTSEAEVDPIGYWVKLKKASGEIDDSLKVVVDMLVELNRKIDKLENILMQNNNKQLIILDFAIMIESIGFEHFQLDLKLLEAEQKINLILNNKNHENIYYGRVDLNVYPQRDVPILFKILDNGLCHIEKIHEKDERDWASYFRAKERVMIREGRK